jgi:anti-sigma regulatory factor (Ser/Thr protein kinase)
MTDPWPLRSSLELGALSTAVPCVCLHVKQVLWEWGLSSLAESAELLVSELVTNAVNASGQPGQTVALNLAGNATRVLIEVRDADPRPPAPSEPGEPGTDGTDGTDDGVLLIAALSTNWNWYPTQDPPGKVVWCELSAEPPADTPPPSLPRRVPRARPKPQAEIVTDHDILRRLRDRLLN